MMKSNSSRLNSECDEISGDGFTKILDKSILTENWWWNSNKKRHFFGLQILTGKTIRFTHVNGFLHKPEKAAQFRNENLLATKKDKSPSPSPWLMADPGPVGTKMVRVGFSAKTMLYRRHHTWGGSKIFTVIFLA